MGISGISAHKSKVCRYLRHRIDAFPGLPPSEFGRVDYASNSLSRLWRANYRCKRRRGPRRTARPAGLGSMSTQRRVNRSHADGMRRVGGLEQGSTFPTRFDHRRVHGLTAPLMPIIWLVWAWLFSRETTIWVATKSLFSDYRISALAGNISRRSSPPPGERGSLAAYFPRTAHRSSLPHIPILPVRTRLHPTLPNAPAGEVRWAERHDGKRDLYFQHAA